MYPSFSTSSMGRLFLFFVLSLFFVPGIYAQSLLLHGWHLKDENSSVGKGISLDQAYSFLRKHKLKPVKINVAVLDNGVDTAHEDLRQVLWINELEVPGNGIDDDANGYIDDRYGWNFLGNSKGENVFNNSSEWIRVYWRFKDKFEHRDTGKIADPLEKYLQTLWVKARSGVVDRAPSAEFVDTLKEQYRLVAFCDSLFILFNGKRSYNRQTLKKYYANNDRERTVVSVLNDFLEKFTASDITNILALEGFQKFIEGEEARFRAAHESPLNERKLITGDDDTSPNVRTYGNPNVAAGETLHGTHVAGIIGAVRGNGKGIDGVADNVRIMTVRTTAEGDEFDKDIAMGIRYAVDNGAKVINMSFGKSLSPDKYMVDDAVRYALSKDVLLVQAAGNSSRDISNWDNYPNPKFLLGDTIADNWITVAAADTNGCLAAFSNFGAPVVNLLAPGVAIHSTANGNNTYLSLDGTSMAAPVVAGIAAMLRSYFPRLSARDTKKILESSAVAVPVKCSNPAAKKYCCQMAVVNALQAVRMAWKYVRKQ